MDMLRRNGARQETMESVRKREGSLGWKWFVEQEGERFVECERVPENDSSRFILTQLFKK